MEELKDYIAVVILRDHLSFQDEASKFVEAVKRRFNRTFKEKEVKDQLEELELDQTVAYRYVGEIQEPEEDY